MPQRISPPDRTAVGTMYPDAVQLECGRFAVRMASGVWRTVKALPDERGLYWCSGGCRGDERCPAHHVTSVAMPKWWTPEHPFAVEGSVADESGFPTSKREVLREMTFATLTEAQAYIDIDPDAAAQFDVRIVTADPATGAEVRP